MRSVSVSTAKNTLSALLRKVAGGTSITITDRGSPVAQLVPPAQVRGIPPRFLELAERGAMKLPDREPTADWDNDLPAAPRLSRGASAVAALLEERRGGR